MPLPLIQACFYVGDSVGNTQTFITPQRQAPSRDPRGIELGSNPTLLFSEDLSVICNLARGDTECINLGQGARGLIFRVNNNDALWISAFSGKGRRGWFSFLEYIIIMPPERIQAMMSNSLNAYKKELSSINTLHYDRAIVFL